MKNFFDCKDEKITEKAFSQSLIISVVSILLCLVVLCSMTYAWFTGETTSAGNSITSGSFDLEVDVVQTKVDGVSVSNKIDVTKDGEGVLSCTLPEAGTYTVTLTRAVGSTAKGYCYIQVGTGEKRATETIVDANTENTSDTNPFKFDMTTTEENTIVMFSPCWGIHASPQIRCGGNMTIDGAAQNANE